ncbi:MAG: heparan-alpha-glucosaminide N-acetyltransferase domain-containing protein [Bacteroidota bacterium]|nr:heparan-alpha-glucosaminide N-acetyltransferase domain-containing protein [Bacteroidota bacterium]
MSPSRVLWIDALRGLAILLMIPANLAPYLSEPHPLWFRIAGSYAAPMFIAISAGMVTFRGSYHRLSYYIKRSLLVLLIGALLDSLLWGIMPGTSWDVLYIIGPGMVVAYMARNARPSTLFIAAAAVFALAFAVRKLAGYDPVPLEVYWSSFSWPEPWRVLRSWFVDGWFPILPWAGFTLFGTAFFRLLFHAWNESTGRKLLAAGLLCAAAGFFLLLLSIPLVENIPGGNIIVSREGYSEIFYPPTPAYLLSAVGVVILAALAVRHVRPHAVTSAVAFFGRYSMLVYILHQVAGDAILNPMIQAYGVESISSGWVFTAAVIGVIAFVALVCFLAERYKKRHPPKSLLLNILFGR